VIAEGVETQEQLELLRKLHCDEYQGFLFSPPVSPAEIESRFLKPFPRHEPISGRQQRLA
jgi:EAL domain-containing protein (putative c-di-GMP-specific phosphodiesterase class I)